MKKRIFTLLLISAILSSANQAFAMEEEFDIRNLTPIKAGMDSQKREETIKEFLKKHLTPENQFDRTQIKETKMHTYGQRSFKTVILEDGSEWVKSKNKDFERFVGFIYLKEGIKNHKLEKFEAVPTKFCYKNPQSDFTIEIANRGPGRGNTPSTPNNLPVLVSSDFDSYSRYVGDAKIIPANVQSLRGEVMKLRLKIRYT